MKLIRDGEGCKLVTKAGPLLREDCPPCLRGDCYPVAAAIPDFHPVYTSDSRTVGRGAEWVQQHHAGDRR